LGKPVYLTGTDTDNSTRRLLTMVHRGKWQKFLLSVSRHGLVH
jgi:hypothetical protein